MKKGIKIIADELKRQRTEKGYSSQHDDTHTNEELARAAMCYAMPEDLRIKAVFGEGRLMRFNLAHGKSVDLYPDGWKFKPSSDDRINELAKAGALIAAEIERLLRKK